MSHHAQERRAGPVPIGLFVTGLMALAASAGVEAAIENAAGWHAQLFPRVRGVRSVRVSQKMSHSGRGSLALTVGLDGRVSSLREGESFVDLRYNPPEDVTTPVDLNGQVISAWFYAPAGLEGPAHNPNGARLFVKDSKWQSEYGPWTHLRPGHWTRLLFTPSADPPQSGFRSPGFDPHRVILLGVSVAVGGGSTTHFTGTAFLDDVAWNGTMKYAFEP